MSSESASRSDAEAGTAGPSDSPATAASPAVVSESSRIARSESPVMRATSGSRSGIGVLEQVCFGPYAPAGFTEFFDGAKD